MAGGLIDLDKNFGKADPKYAAKPVAVQQANLPNLSSYGNQKPDLTGFSSLGNLTGQMGMGQPMQAQQRQQQPMGQMGGGMGGGMNRGMGGGDSNIQPVSSLNPYQSGWKIKVRCTKKDNMRHYHNQKGDGKLFGMDFLDKEGTEIRAVCFNEAADKFYSIIEKDCVYLISRGQVRLARKGFSHITNDYSITINADPEVVQVNETSSEGANNKSTLRYARITGSRST